MSDYPVGKPSLVVVPPVALMQWQSEINVSNSITSMKLILTGHRNIPMANWRYSFIITRIPRWSIWRERTSLVTTLSWFHVGYIRAMLFLSRWCFSDSGLESMYRKEMKGWNREDGIVKEDSMYLPGLDLIFIITDHIRRCDTFNRFPPSSSWRSTQHQGK